MANQDGEGKGQEAIKAELKVKVWELFKKGYTYREMAKLVGRSRSVVGVYIKEELRSLAGETKQIVSDIVERELQTLDDLDKEWLPKALSGDPCAAALVLKFQERRSKYLALDQPTKHEHSGVLVLEDLVHGVKDVTIPAQDLLSYNKPKEHESN